MTLITRRAFGYDPKILDDLLSTGLQESIPYYGMQRFAWKMFMRKGFIYMAKSNNLPIDQSDIDLLDRIYRHKN